jgi:DNA topoisomerase I
VHASLPRGAEPDSFALERAIELLAIQRAKGKGTPRRPARKAAASASDTAKKPARKPAAKRAAKAKPATKKKAAPTPVRETHSAGE